MEKNIKYLGLEQLLKLYNLAQPDKVYIQKEASSELMKDLMKVMKRGIYFLMSS
jgi:23S rRNA (guanosine2251-2'-O)-methyltransferase